MSNRSVVYLVAALLILPHLHAHVADTMGNVGSIGFTGEHGCAHALGGDESDSDADCPFDKGHPASCPGCQPQDLTVRETIDCDDLSGPFANMPRSSVSILTSYFRPCSASTIDPKSLPLFLLHCVFLN